MIRLFKRNLMNAPLSERRLTNAIKRRNEKDFRKLESDLRTVDRILPFVIDAINKNILRAAKYGNSSINVNLGDAGFMSLKLFLSFVNIGHEAILILMKQITKHYDGVVYKVDRGYGPYSLIISWQAYEMSK